MLHVTDLKDTNLVDKIIAYTSVYQPFFGSRYPDWF